MRTEKQNEEREEVEGTSKSERELEERIRAKEK